MHDEPQARFTRMWLFGLEKDSPSHPVASSERDVSRDMDVVTSLSETGPAEGRLKNDREPALSEVECGELLKIQAKVLTLRVSTL